MKSEIFIIPTAVLNGAANANMTDKFYTMHYNTEFGNLIGWDITTQGFFKENENGFNRFYLDKDVSVKYMELENTVGEKVAWAIMNTK